MQRHTENDCQPPSSIQYEPLSPALDIRNGRTGNADLICHISLSQSRFFPKQPYAKTRFFEKSFPIKGCHNLAQTGGNPLGEGGTVDRMGRMSHIILTC